MKHSDHCRLIPIDMNQDSQIIRLALTHLPLVQRLAREYAIKTHLPLDGLEQAALNGLHWALSCRGRFPRPFLQLAEECIQQSLEQAVHEAHLAATN